VATAITEPQTCRYSFYARALKVNPITMTLDELNKVLALRVAERLVGVN
jgi:hypothetical protein